MSELDRRRIRIDWEELEDAFADSSDDHRYYLDRETGAVHFFSSYLDNDEEAEDERAITSENRYVLIPHARRIVPLPLRVEFLTSRLPASERRALESSLGTTESHRRFEDAIADLPSARERWQCFVRERLEGRIKSWLTEVGVDPLE